MIAAIELTNVRLALAGVGLVAIIAITVVVTSAVTRWRDEANLRLRLGSLATRLGSEDDPSQVEDAISHVERATDLAAEAVTDASADAIRLRRALDTLPQAVVICDEHGEAVFSNAKAIDLMGNRTTDAIAAHAVDELLASTAPGESEVRTLELYGPPRRTIVVRTHGLDNGQRALGVMAFIEDVSDKRRLEEVRRDFVANVSHELKTPMGALGLLAETLLSETEPAIQHRLTERIHTEAFRISRVIDDLLDLTRIESEESQSREPILVNLVIAEAAERVWSAAEQRKVTLEITEPSPPLAVLGDRRQLTSAVYNLLENAVKFSYEGKVVRCVGSADGDQVNIAITDEGIGIPARDLSRIFERFYRVDHGRSRQTGGTGLGLAIVRHVAQNHQGSVDVESREGEGATFTLRLPLHGRAS